MTADQCLAAKRQHWSIENQLHWTLDVQFEEDRSKAGSGHSAENLNVLRHIAYNALRQTPDLKGSFSDRQLCCLTDDQVLSAAAGTLAAAASHTLNTSIRLVEDGKVIACINTDAVENDPRLA